MYNKMRYLYNSILIVLVIGIVYNLSMYLYHANRLLNQSLQITDEK